MLKTNGKISQLDKFIQKEENYVIEIDESNLIESIKNDNSSEERLIIICDEPGMGKTIFTKKIAFNLTKSQVNWNW